MALVAYAGISLRPDGQVEWYIHPAKVGETLGLDSRSRRGDIGDPHPLDDPERTVTEVLAAMECLGHALVRLATDGATTRPLFPAEDLVALVAQQS